MTPRSWIRRLFARTSRPAGGRPRTRPGLEVLEDRAVPAVLTVNSLLDNATPDDVLTLREALQAVHDGGAAGLSAQEAAQVDQTEAFGSNDTITFASELAGQTITLSQVGDTTAGPSAFGIAGGTSVTIRGLRGEQGITLAGGGASSNWRAFYVAPGGSLALEHLTLQDFRLKGEDGGSGGWVGDQNGSGGGGGGGAAGLGGALFNEGTLSLLGCTLTGNTAQGGAGGGNGLDTGVSGAGGGPAGTFGSGGGGGVGFGGRGEQGGFGGGGGGGGPWGSPLATVGPAGFGGGAGGGGFSGSSNGGPVVGIAGGGGGGAGMGGAVFSRRGVVTITSSTFSGNAAVGGPGGRRPNSGIDAGANGTGLGGAVFVYNGTVTITNATLSGNTAAGGRGVFLVSDGTGMTAGAVINNSILGQADGGVTDFDQAGINGGNTPTSGGTNNLIRNRGTFGGTSSDADPRLGPLQDNGGPTWTLALLPGSPARNAGNNALAVDHTGAPLPFDQRGPDFARLIDGTVDIGAVEATTDLLAVGSGPGGQGRLNVYHADGSLRFTLHVGGPAFRSSVRVATGDVSGDGVEDVVATAGRGGPPRVWVFDGQTGELLRQFRAGNARFRGGLFLTVADVSGDGHADIVTAPGGAGDSTVRVFDGGTYELLRAVRVYPSGVRGGVRVAAADLTGDGVAELVTAAPSGADVRVFAGPDLARMSGGELAGLRLGTGHLLEAGDLTGDGVADLVVAEGRRGDGEVVIYSGADWSVLTRLQPFESVAGQGVRVTLADLDGDGRLDLLAALGPGTRPEVRGWSLAGPVELLRFDAFEVDFRGGLSLG